MNNQEIIDNEPPKQGKWPDCNQVDSNGKWSHRQPIIRSLADIKRIVELEKENTKLKKIVDNHSGGFVACMTGNQFTANNLKQQAKALNEYAYSNKPLTKRGLNLKSIALIDQAKALKEPKT
jgi:hypothetical protein